jgi:hypothetical protein
MTQLLDCTVLWWLSEAIYSLWFFAASTINLHVINLAAQQREALPNPGLWIVFALWIGPW